MTRVEGRDLAARGCVDIPPQGLPACSLETEEKATAQQEAAAGSPMGLEDGVPSVPPGRSPDGLHGPGPGGRGGPSPLLRQGQGYPRTLAHRPSGGGALPSPPRSRGMVVRQGPQHALRAPQPGRDPRVHQALRGPRSLDRGRSRGPDTGVVLGGARAKDGDRVRQGTLQHHGRCHRPRQSGLRPMDGCPLRRAWGEEEVREAPRPHRHEKGVAHLPGGEGDPREPRRCPRDSGAAGPAGPRAGAGPMWRSTRAT